jgi:hypothetical protein
LDVIYRVLKRTFLYTNHFIVQLICDTSASFPHSFQDGSQPGLRTGHHYATPTSLLLPWGTRGCHIDRCRGIKTTNAEADSAQDPHHFWQVENILER